MHIRHTRRAAITAIALSAAGFGALALAQSVTGGFEGFWGARYAPLTTDSTRRRAGGLGARRPRNGGRRSTREAGWCTGTASPSMRRVSITRRWRPARIGSSASNSGPAAPAGAMAIVHIAIFDAVNAIYNEWNSYTGIEPAPPGASVERRDRAGGARHAREHVSVAGQRRSSAALTKDLERIGNRGQDEGRKVGRRAAGRDPRAAQGRRIGKARAAPRRRLLSQQRAGQVAAGSGEPDPDRAWRALGPGQAVRDRIGQGIPGTGAAGVDEPRLRDGVRRSETPRRRRHDDADRAHRRPELCRHLLGVRRRAEPVRPAAAVQPDCDDHRGPDGFELLRVDAPAHAGERRDGRRRHRHLGIEVSLPGLAPRHRHPRGGARAPDRPAAATAIPPPRAIRRSCPSARPPAT